MKNKGFTLIELMTSVSICAIVLFVGAPILGSMVERERAATSSRTVLNTLAAAREAAVMANSLVSICASMDSTTCEKKWGRSLIIFRDPAGDGKLVESAQVLHVLPLASGWQVHWSAFGKKPQLTINGHGYTEHQNGSFFLCPVEDKGIGRRVTVNKAGRGRIVADKNGNGYSQKSDGSDMSC